MFKSPNIPSQLRSIKFQVIDKDDEVKRLVELVHQLTLGAELANEVGCGVGGHLYQESIDEISGEVRYFAKPEIADATFELPGDLYQLALRIGPDAKAPALALAAVGVSKLKVRRVKDVPLFVATFSTVADLGELTAQEVLWLANSLGSQLFLTFQDVQGDLDFSQERKTA